MPWHAENARHLGLMGGRFQPWVQDRHVFEGRHVPTVIPSGPATPALGYILPQRSHADLHRSERSLFPLASSLQSG
jgi:hypothetical protein